MLINMIMARKGIAQKAILILPKLSNMPIKKGRTVPPRAPSDIIMPIAVPLKLWNFSDVMETIIGHVTEKPSPTNAKETNPNTLFSVNRTSNMLKQVRMVPIFRNVMPFSGNNAAKKRPKTIPAQ